jgi:Zn-dependent peptidase ImmA (M78 family)
MIDKKHKKIVIPSKFKLMGETITVKWSDDILKDDSYGVTHEKRNEIIIQAVDIPEEKKEHTFYHELTHHILYMMGENKLSQNEKFVDMFSGLLHQAIQTAEY